MEGVSVHEMGPYPCKILAVMTDPGSVPLQNSLSPMSCAEPQKFAEPYQVRLTKPLGRYPPQNEMEPGKERKAQGKKKKEEHISK